jgi:RNA polymerase sigma-70 factor (ECF subfamily)
MCVRLYRAFHAAGFAAPKKMVVAARLLRAFAHLSDPGQWVGGVARKLAYRNPRIFAELSVPLQLFYLPDKKGRILQSASPTPSDAEHKMQQDPGNAQDPREHEAVPLDRLVPLLYEQLRGIARHRLQREQGEHSLNTTGLVHEAYLRLAISPDRQFVDGDHFLAVASHVMRNVLVDHARARGTGKRAAATQTVPIEDYPAAIEVDLDGVLDLDDALRNLEEIDARQCKIVECRYFGGLSLEETAGAMNISLSTVKRELRLARAWLAAELTRRSA